MKQAMKVSESNVQHHVRIAEEARAKAEEDSKATKDELTEQLQRMRQEVEALREENFRNQVVTSAEKDSLGYTIQALLSLQLFSGSRLRYYLRVQAVHGNLAVGRRMLVQLFASLGGGLQVFLGFNVVAPLEFLRFHKCFVFFF